MEYKTGTMSDYLGDSGTGRREQVTGPEKTVVEQVGTELREIRRAKIQAMEPISK